MFQIPHELFLVLAADILDGVTYLMENTELDNSIRKHTLDSIWEAFQSVNTSYEYVTDTTGLQVCQYIQPEVSALILRAIHP